MKVFFDEDVPLKLARYLPRHEIHTVVSMQWGGMKNGALLQLIEREGFEIFLTGDKNMEASSASKAVLLRYWRCPQINWPVIRPRIQIIAAALDEARPGTFARIDCGVFIPRLKRTSE